MIDEREKTAYLLAVGQQLLAKVPRNNSQYFIKKKTQKPKKLLRPQKNVRIPPSIFPFPPKWTKCFSFSFGEKTKKQNKKTKAAGNWCKHLSSLFMLLESCFKMSQRHPETFTQATTHAELIFGAYN